MNIEQIKENIRVLDHDIRVLEARLRRLKPDGPLAENIERILNVKWRLLQEQTDILMRKESNAAREAAEARLAYHIENDTLDLY